MIGERHYVTSREYSHLNHIWERDNAEALLEDAFLLVESKALISVDNSLLNAFFENLSELTKPRAVKFLKNLFKKHADHASKIKLILEIVRTNFKICKMNF